MKFPRIRGRWRAIRHHLFVRSFSGLAPYYLVNEFPKSGGTWLAQMLADALDLPFRRNAPIQFERSVSHCHSLCPFGLNNVTVLWRDPRDLLVSYYYHSYFLNEHCNGLLVKLTKKRCPFDDYTDIRSNLPGFIRFVTEDPVSPSFNWPEFAELWAGRLDTLQTSYEVLRADTSGELARIVDELTGIALPEARAKEIAERHSFASARRAAQSEASGQAEVSFVREGALGGWRKHFTAQAELALLECGYGRGMRRLGYKFS